MKNETEVSQEINSQENAYSRKGSSPNRGRDFYTFLFCMNRIITK